MGVSKTLGWYANISCKCVSLVYLVNSNIALILQTIDGKGHAGLFKPVTRFFEAGL